MNKNLGFEVVQKLWSIRSSLLRFWGKCASDDISIWTQRMDSLLLSSNVSGNAESYFMW